MTFWHWQLTFGVYIKCKRNWNNIIIFDFSYYSFTLKVFFMSPWSTKISIKFFRLSCLHVEVHLKSGNNNDQYFENVNKQLKTSSFVLTPASLCGLRFTVWKMSNGKMSLKRFETKNKNRSKCKKELCAANALKKDLVFF